MRGLANRVMSPSGGSTLITSAPRSHSIRVQCGPLRTRVRSRTRIPASGPEPCGAADGAGCDCGWSLTGEHPLDGPVEVLVAPFVAPEEELVVGTARQRPADRAAGLVVLLRDHVLEELD